MISSIKKFQNFLVVVVLHKILIPVVLTATYFIVFGLGSLIARIFARGTFRPQRMNGSYWVEATGYEADAKRSLQQS